MSCTCRAATGSRRCARAARRGLPLHGRDHDALSRIVERRFERLPRQDGAAGAHRRSITTRSGRDFADGDIETVGTDNTSRCRATEEAAKPDCTARGRACRCWARICPRCCTTAASAACRWRSWWSAPPARRPGSTGSIRARARSRSGSDADLVVVDLDAERVVSADDLKGMSDFSPFEGKRLRGWPVATIKAGRSSRATGKSSGRRPAATSRASRSLPFALLRNKCHPGRADGAIRGNWGQS